MQILASALPGFRDLRAPVVAGYLWLAFAWLIVEPNLDKPPTEGLEAAAYDLAERAGPIWVAITASVAAYLVGSISQDISRGLRSVWFVIGRDFFGYGFRVDSSHQIAQAYNRALRILDQASLPPPLQQRLDSTLEARVDEARAEAQRELDLPATLLIGDQAELFAEVDRLRAEGELRMAVVPPLVALAGLLAWEGSFLWLFLLFPIGVLFRQGVGRELDSKKSIADALQIGRLNSSSIAKFNLWIDQELREEISRLEHGPDANFGERIRSQRKS